MCTVLITLYSYAGIVKFYVAPPVRLTLILAQDDFSIREKTAPCSKAREIHHARLLACRDALQKQ